ncbi:MAG: hypothetical protein KDD82_12115 [Planctomycetes bacterium]|nr:hypothetical protein [Planctomycetota bacterium]
MTEATERWPVGCVVRERGDTSRFRPLLVVGHRPGRRVVVLPLDPPPWATGVERATHTLPERDVRPCDAEPDPARGE